MAASCSERRDGKLESFLNRTLPPEEYERLLARQPAVAVVSSDRGGGRGAAAGKPAHRHAVLGHCKLYLTDVPPKNLRTTLLLKHAESIQIVSYVATEPHPLLFALYIAGRAGRVPEGQRERRGC